MNMKEIEKINEIIGFSKIDEEKIKNEKIAVEMFFEKCMEFSNTDYESEERTKITGEGEVLLKKLMDKVYEMGLKNGIFVGKMNVVKEMEKVIKDEKDLLPINFISLLREGEEKGEEINFKDLK